MPYKNFKCYACHGTGEVRADLGRCYPNGRAMYEWVKCFHCGGTGEWKPAVRRPQEPAVNTTTETGTWNGQPVTCTTQEFIYNGKAVTVKTTFYPDEKGADQ
jgi:hypothetical protein